MRTLKSAFAVPHGGGQEWKQANTWKRQPFQRQLWGHFWETGWSAYGLFRAHRYHLELNWTEPEKSDSGYNYNYARTKACYLHYILFHWTDNGRGCLSASLLPEGPVRASEVLWRREIKQNFFLSLLTCAFPQTYRPCTRLLSAPFHAAGLSRNSRTLRSASRPSQGFQPIPFRSWLGLDRGCTCRDWRVFPGFIRHLEEYMGFTCPIS